MWVFGLVVIILLMLYFFKSNEAFTSESQKANTIVSWFNDNQTPKYANFRADTGGDILDYQTGLKLKSQNKLNPTHLQNAM